MKKMKEKKYVILNVASIIVFLVLWQLFSMYNEQAQIMNPKYLPGPISVVQTVFEYIFDKGTLFQHIWASLYRILGGFLLGSVVAVIIGYISSKSKIFANIFDPIFNIFGPIPAYAFMPLFIIWFGIGELPKFLMIAYVTFFPMLSYTREGINSINPVLIRAAMSLGANQWQIFKRVTFKAAFPSIISGMKTSLALAFSGLVVAEMMGSDLGLGYIIVDSKNWFRVSDMFMAMFLIAAEYLIIYFILSYIEKKLFKWKKTGISAVVENN